MVDSSDTERIGTSAEEFHAILDEEELRDALILVYANKQAGSLHPRPTGMRTAPALRRLTAQRCACKADMAEGTHHRFMRDGRPNCMALASVVVHPIGRARRHSDQALASRSILISRAILMEPSCQSCSAVMLAPPQLHKSLER